MPLFSSRKGNTEALSLKGYTLAAMGRRREAEQVLRTLLQTARARFVPPYNFALLYAGLGDSDAAYEWLEKARLVRDVHMVFLTVEPKWDPLRGQPQYQTLLQRCGLPVLEPGNILRFPARKRRASGAVHG